MRILYAGGARFTADLVRSRIPGMRDTKALTWGIRPIERNAQGPYDFDVITVSRLVSRKNVDTVLKAIRTIGNFCGMRL
jgi:glycosyltransferase involved in cell wall biosynthesis